MSRIYTVSFAADIAAGDGDVDLLELLPADDKPCRLVGFVMGNTSDVGDAQEEGIGIDVLRLPATVTSGSGGATLQTGKTSSTDAALGFTAEVRNTTVATTSGSIETLDSSSWNLRGSPLERWWMDEKLRFEFKQGEALCIRWMTTVADTVSVRFTAYIEELG